MRKYTIISIVISLIVVGIIFYFISAREVVAPGEIVGVPIENEFDSKTVYTTDMNFDKKILLNDCAMRGGSFNECGSVCEAQAEMCIEVCAYTCEFEIRKPLDAEPAEFTAETTKLETVSDFGGEGIATREYDGIAYIHTVTVKLDAPPEGRYFMSWLINPLDPDDYFTSGRLEKAGGGYALTYTSKENKLKYAEILITLETEDNDVDTMGEKILFGVFKERGDK